MKRLSYTTQARLALVFSPVLLPLALVWNIPHALRQAGREFLFAANFGGVWSDFYRNVYRVSRYGSVHDEPRRDSC